MKNKYFFLGWAISFLLFCNWGFAQITILPRQTAHFSRVVYYGIPKDKKMTILPPSEVLERMKSGSTKKADIEVTYHNFPTDAKAAFDYAVNIWASLLYSTVPIRIDATWEKLDDGVLGSTSPSVYYAGVSGSPHLLAYYPVVLAEKIVGKDLNGENEPDMYASFSSSANWYRGTDGKTPLGEYDLVTTVLHELCHGLGFIASFSVDARTGVGSYGLGTYNFPMVFDKYVVNANGNHLIDTSIYALNSTVLAAALQNSQVYFSSNIVKKVNGGNNAKLYAPRPWSDGSSIAHLDDIYDSTLNALMTYSINTAESIHDPGTIALAMLDEIGWVNTWISHDALPDVEDISNPVQVKATIHSDTALIRNSMLLYYSTDSFKTSYSEILQPTGNTNEYSAEIPLTKMEQRIFYYLSVTDTFQRTYTAPSGAPGNFYSFYVGVDTTKPVITHESIPYILTTTDSVPVHATVSDNLGVDSVFVEYKIDGVEQPAFSLKNDSLTYYSGYFNLKGLSLADDDSISYRIVAVDASKQANTAYLPDTGYYVIQVEPVPEPVETYDNDFSTTNYDFILNGFEITQPTAFYTPGLHTKHPYPSPDMDNQSYNFTAQLRIPIILRDPHTYLTFWEMALVEPGATGSTYGTDAFYDYVVVEGSKDGGNSWIPFISGWDSRAYTEWLTRWNSSSDSDGNSTAVGDVSLYKIRVIDILSNTDFAASDTILIRFRLYSDPYTHGWGWAIDNIHIQDYVGVDDQKVSDQNITLYPNPANDHFTLTVKNIESSGPVQISFLNMLGQTIWKKDITVQNQELSEDFSLGNAIRNGVYLVKISMNNKTVTRRLVVSR